MAHPKRKISKTRRDKRRTHYKLEEKAIFIDPVTGDESLYHRVNLETGMYRGRKVMKGTNDNE
jgi:large subunit ribosomal protein L32